MSELAPALRKLASDIEELCRDSPAYSVAWPIVSNLTNHLTLRALVADLFSREDEASGTKRQAGQ